MSEMEVTIQPTENDLTLLKSQIVEAKRKAEYDRLKLDLENLSQNADGAMQTPDTHKVLKGKRSTYHFFDILFGRIKEMFSLRPIIGNIIALMIACLTLFYILNEVNTKSFGEYQGYFSTGIQIFAAIQIIKSATRGLLLPFLALVLGGFVGHSLGAHQTLFNFGKTFYEYLTITGIIGLGVAVLSID